jgi:hypothetical protein
VKGDKGLVPSQFGDIENVSTSGQRDEDKDEKKKGF